MTTNTKILVVCLLLLGILITFSLFEYKDVSTTKWQPKFDYNDKEPMGLFVFKEIVDEYYSERSVTVEPYYKDSTTARGLYIYTSMYSPSYEAMDSLVHAAKQGNDVLVIASTYAQKLNEHSDFDAYDITVSTDRLEFRSSRLDSSEFYTYRFKNTKFENADTAKIRLFDHFDETYNSTEYFKAVTKDEYGLMISHKFGKGSIYSHAVPEIFYNHSYQQLNMFDYTEEVLSNFDPDYVMFLKNILPNKAAPERDNPLQYIMSNAPLKTAYFTLLFGLLAYAIVGGRRRQKAIQITEKNENTSLEYVDTISQLFQQQSSHEKLVAHMSEIFYHKMEKRFFIKKQTDDYLNILAKKSKIDYEELRFVLDRFKNVEDGYSFQDDQLVNLNKRLRKIYNTLENPKKPRKQKQTVTSK